MFATPVSLERRRELAEGLTTFLSKYKHLSDSYVVEFFTEELWLKLPVRWQQVLGELSPPQIADLLLDPTCQDRRYPSVWPLSLLAFRATAHALAFPRVSRQQQSVEVDKVNPLEFSENRCQSSMLGHIFRKHVKPKKQHEIRKLGTLVKQLCDQTSCDSVVDVGSGQGHLTRFLSFGLGLSVTAIEADHKLVAMANKFDEELLWTLEKEKQRQDGSSCLSAVSPRHVAGWVNPKASWECFIQQLEESECVHEARLPPSASGKKRRWDSAAEGDAHVHTTGPDCLSVKDCDIHGTAPQHQSSPPPVSDCGSEAGKRLSAGSCIPSAKRDFVLTGLHACGDLSATLLRHFVTCPHVQGITSVACCYMKITTKEHPSPPGVVASHIPPTPAHRTDTCPSEFGYPLSSWVRGLPGHQLSYKAREGACHAVEDYMERLREESGLLRTHCYRATLETIIRAAKPELRRAGIQTIKKAYLLPFTEYARLGLPRVGLPATLPLQPDQVEAMLEQQNRVVVFFSLALLLAPVVETLVLLDRLIYLQENGVASQLVPLFDPKLSPRNFVLVALKPAVDREGQQGSL